MLCDSWMMWSGFFISCALLKTRRPAVLLNGLLSGLGSEHCVLASISSCVPGTQGWWTDCICLLAPLEVGFVPLVSILKGRKLTVVRLLIVSPIYPVRVLLQKAVNPVSLHSSKCPWKQPWAPFSPIATVCQLLPPLFSTPAPFGKTKDLAGKQKI